MGGIPENTHIPGEQKPVSSNSSEYSKENKSVSPILADVSQDSGNKSGQVVQDGINASRKKGVTRDDIQKEYDQFYSLLTRTNSIIINGINEAYGLFSGIRIIDNDLAIKAVKGYLGLLSLFDENPDQVIPPDLIEPYKKKFIYPAHSELYNIAKDIYTRIDTKKDSVSAAKYNFIASSDEHALVSAAKWLSNLFRWEDTLAEIEKVDNMFLRPVPIHDVSKPEKYLSDLTKVIDAISDFDVKTLINVYDSVQEKISDAIGRAENTVTGLKVTKTAGAIAAGILEGIFLKRMGIGGKKALGLNAAGSALYAGLVQYVESAVEAEINNTDTDMGKVANEAVWSGLLSFVPGPKKVFKGAVNKVRSLFGKSPKTVPGGVKGVGKTPPTKPTGPKSGPATKPGAPKGGLPKLGPALKGGLSNIVSSIGAGLSKIFSGIATWFTKMSSAIRAWIPKIISGVTTGIPKLFSIIGTWFTRFFSSIGAGFTKIISGARELPKLISSFKSSLLKKRPGIKVVPPKKDPGLKNRISKKGPGKENGLSNNGVRRSFTVPKTSIKPRISPKIGAGSKSGISNILPGIKSGMSDKLSSIKNGVKNKWPGIKSGLSNQWANTKDGFKNFSKGIDMSEDFYSPLFDETAKAIGWSYLSDYVQLTSNGQDALKEGELMKASSKNETGMETIVFSEDEVEPIVARSGGEKEDDNSGDEAGMETIVFSEDEVEPIVARSGDDNEYDNPENDAGIEEINQEAEDEGDEEYVDEEE